MNEKRNETLFDKIVKEIRDIPWETDFDIALAGLIAGLIIVFAPVIVILYLKGYYYHPFAIALYLMWFYLIIQAIKDYRRKIFGMFSKIFVIAWLILFITALIIIASNS